MKKFYSLVGLTLLLGLPAIVCADLQNDDMSRDPNPMTIQMAQWVNQTGGPTPGEPGQNPNSPPYPGQPNQKYPKRYKGSGTDPGSGPVMSPNLNPNKGPGQQPGYNPSTGSDSTRDYRKGKQQGSPYAPNQGSGPQQFPNQPKKKYPQGQDRRYGG